MDPLFRVETIAKTPNPQQVIYRDMHQCYSDNFAIEDSCPSESKSGEIIVRNLLKGGRGHYGPLENPQITLNVGWFPHSTMQQIRTHRVGVHFSVQSFRYTGQRLIRACEEYQDRLADDSGDGLMQILEDTIAPVIYLRPVGTYTDRAGKKYDYDQHDRYTDLGFAHQALERYRSKIAGGFSEEHARGLIPFDVRQHWVMSANVRSLMHLLDLRWKADAQLECQQLCDLIWPHFESWVPEIAAWYKDNRAKKARLAP